MDRRGNRPSASARCLVVAALALGAVACGEQPSPRTSETTASSPARTDDAAAIAAAEATVRAFFAVEGRAEDPIRVQIDKQAAYLTSRDVHPTTTYEDDMGDRPSGITDAETSVELSDTRRVGDEIMVDFAFESTGTSYQIRGDELQLDAGQPQEAHWDGTATLEERDGAWLINDLTIDSYGGSIS